MSVYTSRKKRRIISRTRGLVRLIHVFNMKGPIASPILDPVRLTVLL